jgi:hypothetical protein
MLPTLFSVVVAALSVQQAVSHPLQVEKRSNPDTTVLNYALTLEHIEYAFYTGALAKFDEKCFEEAGLPWGTRDRFVQIAAHETVHVELLTGALGDQAVQPCQYSFPYNDVKSFAALSQILEGVGTAAYTGAAASIVTPAYLTVAASILSTEARHATWVASAVNKDTPWYGPFETPLPPPVVVGLAVPFITSCPSTNPPLNLTPLPSLTLVNAAPGQNATVQLQGSTKAEFVVFYSGLLMAFVPIDSNGQVTVPANVTGLAYAVATTSGTEATAQTIVAGPAILTFDNGP